MGFELYGSEASGVDFSALDPMLIPCASRITLYDNTTIGAEDNCVWDHEKMPAYMGKAFNMLSLHNQQVFEKTSFGESRIKSSAVFNAQFTQTNTPVWTPTSLQLGVLEDEVDLFQIG